MNNIILGGCIIIISIVYLFFLLKRRRNKINDIWSASMLYKGFASGVLFIIIGVILIVKGCNGQ